MKGMGISKARGQGNPLMVDTRMTKPEMAMKKRLVVIVETPWLTKASLQRWMRLKRESWSGLRLGMFSISRAFSDLRRAAKKCCTTPEPQAKKGKTAQGTWKPGAPALMAKSPPVTTSQARRLGMKPARERLAAATTESR